MPVNPDFRDLFSALSVADADFIVVGAHAVMVYTVPRYTKDLDVWVRPTSENAARVYRALTDFGAPMEELRVEDLAVEGTVFQIGVEPNRIDVVTSITAVAFQAAWERKLPTTYGGIQIFVLAIEDLLTNKRAVGRPQDLLDVESLLRRRESDDG